jgi:hypothetical protein
VTLATLTTYYPHACGNNPGMSFSLKKTKRAGRSTSP